MKKVKVYIERADDGSFSTYMPDEYGLDYGLSGVGYSATEAFEDFQAAYDGMREFYSQQKQPFTELQFCFHYDIASFLAYYSKRLSLAGLERITGVSQAQLSHYMNGYRHPSAKTIRKIESALHAFAKDLQQVRLI